MWNISVFLRVTTQYHASFCFYDIVVSGELLILAYPRIYTGTLQPTQVLLTHVFYKRPPGLAGK